jgi:hypothetical protein
LKNETPFDFSSKMKILWIFADAWFCFASWIVFVYRCNTVYVCELADLCFAELADLCFAYTFCCCCYILLKEKAHVLPIAQRLEALGVFLEQCRREDSFETLRAQQYEVLVTNLKALGRVPFEEGSRLVGLLQKQPWSESQRTALIAMVQEKVVAHAATTASSAKVERQNWTNLAMFFARRGLVSFDESSFTRTILVFALAGDLGPPAQADFTISYGGCILYGHCAASSP